MAKSRKSSKASNQLVGNVCLYGTHRTGAGWLAQSEAGMYGDGAPKEGRSFTEAYWQACDSLSKAGFVGIVRVYAAGGDLFADVDTRESLPYFGSLTWLPALPVMIPAEAIEAAAAAQSAPKTDIYDSVPWPL